MHITSHACFSVSSNIMCHLFHSKHCHVTPAIIFKLQHSTFLEWNDPIWMLNNENCHRKCWCVHAIDESPSKCVKPLLLLQKFIFRLCLSISSASFDYAEYDLSDKSVRLSTQYAKSAILQHYSSQYHDCFELMLGSK